MEKLKTSKHWTSGSANDFTYRVASDFIAQIENNLEKTGTTKTELSTRLNRTLGRVSQLFNPGNIRLSSAVQLGASCQMKVALVAYDDNDPTNEKGPINSEIFHQCWIAMRRPQNFFDLADQVADVELSRWEHEAANYDEQFFILSPSVSASTRNGLRTSIQ